jgi:hypothetical protein
MPDSEELRLVGTFQGKISPGLKSSIDKIKAFTREGQRAGEDGARSTAKHAKAFAKLREKLKHTVELTRDGFLPGLEKTVLATSTAGIGIGGVTAAIGLATAAARQLRRFGGAIMGKFPHPARPPPSSQGDRLVAVSA